MFGALQSGAEPSCYPHHLQEAPRGLSAGSFGARRAGTAPAERERGARDLPCPGKPREAHLATGEGPGVGVGDLGNCSGHGACSTLGAG